MFNDLWHWWQSLSLKDGMIVVFYFMLVVLMIYWYGLKNYDKGLKDGWKKGYDRGKAVASERHID